MNLKHNLQNKIISRFGDKLSITAETLPKAFPTSDRMENPLISVIIPAHNNANTISVAIESMVQQTYPNLEIIVVNDNSTDQTEDIVKELSLKYKNVFYYNLPFNDPNRLNKRGRNINAGYSARNYAFEKIKGEWITFQDADDVSLLNRIEEQHKLATKYQATHLCVDWQQFNPKYLGKKLAVDQIINDVSNIMLSPQEILKIKRRSKGIMYSIFGSLNKYIPFEWKRLRGINKLFFGSLESYPGTGNSPLFKREVIEKVKFRQLSGRVWPSFMGRGADRDFNFQVSETFKNSYVFYLPLYLWRQNLQNERYVEYDKYII